MKERPGQCMTCGAKSLEDHIRKIQRGFYSHPYKPKWKEKK